MNKKPRENPAYISIKKRYIIEVFICLAIITVLVLLILPMFSNYTERSRINHVLGSLEASKQFIESELLDETPGVNTTQAEKHIPDYMLHEQYAENGEPIVLEYKTVTTEGEIHLLFSGLYSYLRLQPKVTNNIVTWHCYGRPVDLMPVNCH